MEKIIQIEESTAILTTSEDISGCDHDWSEEILIFHNKDGEMNMKEFKSLSDDEKEQLHVKGGSAACSKCKLAFWDVVNPHYME